MTTTYQIAEVARRSGFPATTLRYYEDVGLVAPTERTDAGYRLYDDQSLARLAFIARAKQLGCTLEEITDLVTAWEGERCEPVQARLRGLVEAKLTETQERLVEMVAFSAQLREAAAALSEHTPEGPCDDNCGCTTHPASSAPLTCRAGSTSGKKHWLPSWPAPLSTAGCGSPLPLGRLRPGSLTWWSPSRRVACSSDSQSRSMTGAPPSR
ncbi:MAG: MerR family transcriptional regulator [Acidimicrobiales bacterium]|nr:MerR family transcriptional regulator [Acidimicrobiales bacterium]